MFFLYKRYTSTDTNSKTKFNSFLLNADLLSILSEIILNIRVKTFSSLANENLVFFLAWLEELSSITVEYS